MEAGCVVAAVIENAASGPQGEPGCSHVLEGDVAPFSQMNKDNVLPQATNSSPADERQPQDMRVRSDDVIERPAEPLLRSCTSTASMKVKNMKKLTFPRGHFPRLEDCAHFHYETVDFGNVELAFAEGQSEGPKAGQESKELLFLVQITCQARNWLVKRSYEDFRVLDKHLHLCIYDRRYSQLTELPKYDPVKDTAESVTKMLATYLSRFSAIADNKINCGPVLTWMEVDNKGNHLLVSEEASINVPAIAAAHVTKRYTAQATDELTFEVGDIVSVIDMPPKEDTGWWRGKHGFQVGFFPCDCVELINDKIPPSVQSSVPKPVCKKHGKLVTFLRSFMKSRPPPQKLRQRGILRERVFGCDLGEHLHNAEHEVPQVVQSCAEFIEKRGVVDGIYRLSGISSNIQKLRHEFDSEQIPDLSRDVFRQDIHSVGSLCKLYFRELPNPLLTYQLYDKFSEAVSAATDEDRLAKIHNVIQQLPPPHYRTLEYLMRHLSRLATFSSVTNMHTKNLAIVWAPNLLRSKQIESACFSGTAAFMEVRIQSVVVEFILNNTEALFSSKLNAIIRESTGNSTLSRPKSLLVCSPSTKLLSLEEAQARSQAQLSSPATTPCLTHSDYIEVGEGPGALLGKFHTVIELPMESAKRAPSKAKKSPVGNWLSFFHLGKSNSVSKRKLKRHPSEPNEIKSIALPGRVSASNAIWMPLLFIDRYHHCFFGLGGRGDSGTLRSAKSEESLTSLHTLEGEPPKYQHLGPCSTSEAVSASNREDLGRSQRKLFFSQNGADGIHTSVSPPNQEDDIDLYPPAAGISTLDFDPMSFKFSLVSATPKPQRNKEGQKLRKSAGCSSESDPVTSPNNNSPLSPEFSPTLTKVGTSDGAMVDGKDSRAPYRHCSAASQASVLTESTQNLPDPGADRLMSSVSILPPHPSPTSAARKLALALAESAQKASRGSQRQRSHRAHPLQRQEAQDRPPRPSALELNVFTQRWIPEENSIPVQFLPAHVYSQPLQFVEGQDSSCNFTPNVSPLGSGSLDEGSAERRGSRPDDVTPEEPTYHSVGVSTPTEPVCSVHSPLTSPIYANADTIDVFNFRAVLAETSMPASIDEVLPRSFQSPSALRHSYRALGRLDDVYRNPHHQHPQHVQPGRILQYPRPAALPSHLSGPRHMYRQSSENRSSSSGLGHPLSPQYRRYHQGEHLTGARQRQQSPWQRSDDGLVLHPAIRRARSFHTPQISRYELAATGLLPPDTMFYSEQEALYQRLLQFDDVQVLHNNPISDLSPCDDSRYPLDPFQRNSQPYRMRSMKGRASSEYYHYSPRHGHPQDKGVYMESERFAYQKQENQSGHKNMCSPQSPYHSPVSPADSMGREIKHIRSTSDPGNGILSADRREAAAKSTSQGSHLTEHEITRQWAKPGPARRGIKDSTLQQAPLRKIPSLPEKSRANLTEWGDRTQMRGHKPDWLEMTGGGYRASMRGDNILRRPGRSQSIKESCHHYAKSPPDAEHAGSFSTQLNRRTQSTKVRPTQYDHMLGGYYAAPRPKPARASKAGPGYSPGQDGAASHGHKLLSKPLAQEAFYHSAVRTQAGVHE
ncbi:LOW QUALITY PROTEIN: rho GTPase-activating protein 32 [Dunckerocampus dactyliophorus]|uniref:LOW QUALITY PROTEIN: rho GTPase-activating protein 32 n=1 Tax=Dunckerocampus dactyliophorus TaxID=161453 RepID=UPI002404B0F9|nr:LOW QUALITY PROTEIN: rho GTPase-activating protein 32 [Dunckerocampus dactyliophorus]